MLFSSFFSVMKSYTEVAAIRVRENDTAHNGGGAYSKVDLSIVRLHFELGTAAAGGEFSWEGTWR